MESALVLCQSLFPCWDVFPFYRSQYYWPALTCWQPTTWTQALCFIFNNFIYFLKYKLLMQYKMFIFFFLNLYESRMAQQLHSHQCWNKRLNQIESSILEIIMGNCNFHLIELDWISSPQQSTFLRCLSDSVSFSHRPACLCLVHYDFLIKPMSLPSCMIINVLKLFSKVLYLINRTTICI